MNKRKNKKIFFKYLQKKERENLVSVCYASGTVLGVGGVTQK
jgi:hypothetical protein